MVPALFGHFNCRGWLIKYTGSIQMNVGYTRIWPKELVGCWAFRGHKARTSCETFGLYHEQITLERIVHTATIMMGSLIWTTICLFPATVCWNNTGHHANLDRSIMIWQRATNDQEDVYWQFPRTTDDMAAAGRYEQATSQGQKLTWSTSLHTSKMELSSIYPSQKKNSRKF